MKLPPNKSHSQEKKLKSSGVSHLEQINENAAGIDLGSFYHMWKNNGQYSDPGQDYYEKKYHEQLFKNLQHKANAMGLQLVPLTPDTPQASSSVTLAT